MKTTIQPEAPCISYPFAKRAKRRRSSSSVTPTASDPGDNAGDDDSDYASHSSERLIPLQIGDVEQCRGFFLLGFQAIQQIDCRFLAKRWIKKIEPKKQVHHPYNGGKRDPKDPEATKPKWWPPGMTHKEPDHINKSGEWLSLFDVYQVIDENCDQIGSHYLLISSCILARTSSSALIPALRQW